jgi:uncharacterized protein with HEPN domain
MRNKISHGYFGVNVEIIWETIETDFSLLYEKISAIYKKTL